jgi:4-hydroxy-tetrahydrodipicolinate synthase
MSKWIEAANRFEERRDTLDYFEVQSALSAIEKIHYLLTTTFRQLIFLLGEPGSGKSFLLNHLKEEWKEEWDILLIETPFLTPLDLLKKLLNHKDIDTQGDDIEKFRLLVTELYRNSNHIIMIDEAQLLSSEMKEFIRILTDSKGFWFILAMHQSEGESILKAPHFKSRPHHTLQLNPLSVMECKNYVHRELLRIGFSELVDELGIKLIRKAHHLSHGNFRNFKKILYHMFHLLHYTNSNNRTSFLRPTSCMITMAAMSAELLDD